MSRSNSISGGPASPHPRSAAVRHKGTPDYDLAAELVRELPVPVIVSGGMEGAEHIRQARSLTLGTPSSPSVRSAAGRRRSTAVQ